MEWTRFTREQANIAGTSPNQSHVYFRRDNVTALPQSILSSDSSRPKLIELIEKIKRTRVIQGEIDDFHPTFVKYTTTNEGMATVKKCTCAYKRFKRCSEQWSDSLQNFGSINPQNSPAINRLFSSFTIGKHEVGGGGDSGNV